MHQLNPTKDIIKGASILTIGGLIVKILSAIYRIPFQNIVGDKGFYIYQQVYPFYGIAMAIALNAFPNDVSHLLVWQNDPKPLIKKYGMLLILLSWGIGLFTFFSAGFLAERMGDRQLTLVIQSSSAAFFLAPFLAMMRGFLQSHQEMKGVAIAQVLEQFLRVGWIIGLALVWKIFPFSLYDLGAFAMLSALIGGGASFIYLFNYLKKYHSPLITTRVQGPLPTWRGLIKHLSTQGFLLVIYSSLLIFFQFVDSFSVVNHLQEGGISFEQATILKGIYDRAQPFVQLGLVVSASLGASYLPELSRALAQRKEELFNVLASSYLRLTLFISLLLAGGMIAITPGMNQLLFEESVGNTALSIYFVLIILISEVLALHYLFQARGDWKSSFILFILAIGIKIGLNDLLVPYLNINGAALSTVLAVLVMMVGLRIMLTKEFNIQGKEKNLFFKGMVLFFMMVISLRGVHFFFFNANTSRFIALIEVFISIGIGILETYVFTRLVPLLKQEEWAALPYFDKIEKYWKPRAEGEDYAPR